MTTRDAYLVGLRLLAVYCGALALTSLGSMVSSYWTAAMMTTSPTSSEYITLALKSMRSHLIYPVLNGLTCLVLLTRARSIAIAFDRSDRKSNGEQPAQ